MSTVETIFLSAAAVTFVSGFMVVAINPWRTINQTYLIATILSSIWLLCIYLSIRYGLRNEQKIALSWLRATNTFAAFLPWSFGLVKVAITNPRPLSHLVRESWLWFISGCVLVVLVYTDSFILEDSTSKLKERGITYAIYVAALSVLCVFILIDSYRNMRHCNGIRLLELKFFVINICISALVILALFIASGLFDILMLRYLGPFVFFASYGLTMWAICHHRVFDARQVFATLGRRASTLVVLAGSIQIAYSYLSEQLTKPVALTTSACIGGILATYWDRLICRWLNLDAKQILAGPRAQIIEWSREEADVDKLTARFEAFLKQWCQAEIVSIHTAESRVTSQLILGTANVADTFPLLRRTGYITPETLTRRRPDRDIQASKAVLNERNLAALIAVPRDSPTPSCVVAFGHKNSLRPYTYPDIQLLIELVELMDNILAQARAAMRTAQIERMESAAMMSRGLAHDLNNLATPVSSFLLHMESRVAARTPEAEVLADAKHSIRVMQDYIRESLFFARRHVPDFQWLTMDELLASTVKLTHGRAQARGIALVVTGKGDMTFNADRAMMLRLMQNLVFNGIDATPRGGQVTLSGRKSGTDRIIITVTDQGPGVPPKHVDHIFEPFFTTKDTGNEIRGLGLGLAISQKISDLHGGELRVGNSPSGGAVFTFVAPLNPANPTSSALNPKST